MRINFFSPVEDFRNLRDKRNRGLTVTFIVKNSLNYWKNQLNILSAYDFVGK